MKVYELIEQLKKWPGNMPVYDWEDTEMTYVKYRQAEDFTINDPHGNTERIVFPERIEIG